MKSNYKKLGAFISPQNFLNDGMEVKELLGISNQKYFQKSHTNTIGIDLSTYRIVRTNQFAFNRATTRNGEKISIALRQGSDCIVSPSYRIFQVNDENELLSEYLLMWFKRPEFDRYVRFKSHGSAHEFFEYDQMCEVELPIPSITKQREIVKEYNIIQKRIVLNQQLIQKLEETAQAIYKHWFVDFEFPDENGKPYKSSGGEMVWNEQLGKEIPAGWEVGTLGDILECNPETLSYKDTFKTILYLDTSSITNNKINELQELNLELDEIPSRARRKVKDNDIIFSTVRPVLRHYGIIKNLPENLIVSTGFAVFRVKKLDLFPELIYSFLTDDKTLNFLQAKAEMSVSTYPSVTSDDILNLDFAIPSDKTLNLTRNIFKRKEDFINLKNKENQKLSEMKNLLLSKLATIEN